MEISRVRDIFCILTWVMVSRISHFLKLNQVILFRSVHFCCMQDRPPQITWVSSCHSTAHNLPVVLLFIQSKSQRPFSGLRVPA